MPYRLALTPEFANVHDVFHVLILKKCIVDPIHVLDQPPIELERNLQYKEQLVRIMDSRVKQVRNKVIPLVKVWVGEPPCEKESDMWHKYSHLFEQGTILIYTLLLWY